MKYQSQKIALTYFSGAMLLFVLSSSPAFGRQYLRVAQFSFRADAVQYRAHDPYERADRLAPARVLRRLLLSDPGRIRTEIHSTRLAYIQFAILMLGAVGAVVGYIFRVHEGREFLEQPLWVKIGIIVAALISSTTSP